MLELYMNIRKRREELGLNQTQLAKLIGYADKTMISKIEKGQVDLPQSKIVIIADALRTTPAALMGWEKEENAYYLNHETTEIAQQIKDSKELSALFDVGRGMSPEDLQTVYQMALALKRKEQG